MENQHVVTSPVTRVAAIAIPQPAPTASPVTAPIPVATRRPFGFTGYDTSGMADGEIQADGHWLVHGRCRRAAAASGTLM